MASWYNLDYFAGKYFSPNYFGGAVLFVPTTFQLTTYFEPDYFGLQNFNANYFSPVSVLTPSSIPPTATTSIYFSLDYFGTQDFNENFFSPGLSTSNIIVPTLQNASYFNLSYFGVQDFNPNFFSPGTVPSIQSAVFSAAYFDIDYFGTANFNPNYFTPGPVTSTSPIIVVLSTTSSYFDTDYFGATSFNPNYWSPGGISPVSFPFQINFVADGALSIISMRRSQLLEQITGDGNFSAKAGKATSSRASYILSGDFGEIGGRRTTSKLIAVSDGDLAEIGGKKSQSSESFVGDTNLRFTPGRKAKAVVAFNEDGNLLLSAGIKTQTYFVSNNEGSFSERYANRLVLSVPITVDAGLNVTGNFLAGGGLKFVGDGDLMGFPGIIGPQTFPDYPYFQLDGDLSLSAGLTRRASANFSVENSAVVNGGKLLSANTDLFYGDGNFKAIGIRASKIVMTEAGDGRLSVLGGAIYATLPTFISDGSFKQANGIISSRNVSIFGDGDYSQITVKVQAMPPPPNTFDIQGDLVIGGVVTAPLGYIVNFILSNAAENSVVSFTLRRT